MKAGLLRIMLFLCFVLVASSVYAEERPKDLKPAKNLKIPKSIRQKAEIRNIPSPIVNYYDEHGEKQSLPQHLGFVALKFNENPISQKERYAFYESIRLVISEVKNAKLLKNELYVLRLLRGATEKHWRLFQKGVLKRKQIAYVGKVLKQQGKGGLTDLVVVNDKVRVHLEENSRKSALETLEKAFPIERNTSEKIEDPSSIIYDIGIREADPIDLANRMHEMHVEGVHVVSPVFIIVEGKPVDGNVRKDITEGYIEHAPEKFKKKVKERFMKADDEGKKPEGEGGQK